jgi:SAM-dependent methyltransferase
MVTNNEISGTVHDHYDRLLGPIYSWIIGDFESGYEKSVELFTRLNIRADRIAAAIDLGCGSGCQSIALAEAGFRVTSIDFCENLLAELRRRSGDREIRTVNDDVLNFAAYIAGPVELIVCMGDTLVHLPDEQSVYALLDNVANALRPGGTFVATLRDYSTPPPVGPDRFLPVRSDDERIFTCFLEYKGRTIDVHDILHTRQNGEWRMQVSRYQKLCLDYCDVVDALRRQALEVDDVSEHRGMKVIVARKPA